ncbi:MAG: DUF84 family protein [bacterium]|nr:DUF84 family protein [bacterium]
MSGPAPGRLAGVRRVRVGSTNPPKLEGVRNALAAYCPEAEILGSEVPSGVSEQPCGFIEIQRGARNRAEAARKSGACDLAVGYEDGLVEVEGAGWLNIGCAAVMDAEHASIGLSSGFSYPPACIQPAVENREPIGEVFDALWRRQHPDAGRTASALSTGNVGKLSAGVLTRAEYTRHAVLCALVSWLHPDLYAPGVPT